MPSRRIVTEITEGHLKMELKTYFMPLIRWWWLLLLAGALAAGTSFWAVRQEPDQYRSQTTLMIGQAIQDPNPSGNQLNLRNQLAQAYADIAMREPVRQATMDELGLEWLPEYNVTALPNRQLIEIVVLDTDPARAQAVASELANQLIQLSPDGSQVGERDRQAFITAQLDRLEEQITATEEEILVKEEALGELFSAQEIAATQSEINALQSKLSALQSTYAGLLSGTRDEAVNTLNILEPAYYPTRPVGPNPASTVLVATSMAFVLAAGAAFLLEYLDDTIKTPDQITKRFDIPVVGTIARLQDRGKEVGLVMRDAPRSPEAEGFRGLRLAVQFALTKNYLKTLLVTSPNQAEGKSMVSANLAVALAQAGLRTLLIDVDLHRPSLHKLFGLSNREGMTTLLAHFESREEKSAAVFQNGLVRDIIVRDTGQERLSVITSGPPLSNPSELIVGGAVRTLIDSLAAAYDVILLDSPPALAVSDAAALSIQVDSVFVLASAQRTRKSDLERVLERLKSVGANVAGVILNQLSLHSEYNYYHYSDYGNVIAGEQARSGPVSERGNAIRERLFGRPAGKRSVTSQGQSGDS